MRNVAITVGLLALLGMGCSDPEPLDVTEEGTLDDSDPTVAQDNSPYDEYTFEAAAGWTIVADMSSTEFDTYLWLIAPNGASLIQDDDSGSGPNWGEQNGRRASNSRITYTIPANEAGSYTLRANSFDGAGRGAYSLHYTAGPSGGGGEAE